MRYLYLLFAACLPCTALLAQQRFVPATVYLPAGDSLVGEMDYRRWDVDPQSVSFRSNGTVSSYTAETIRGFRIHENDERYIALPGDIDVTPENVAYLSAEQTRTIEKGNHFFRLVLNGPVQLLQLTDKLRRLHFAVRTSDTVLHLIREVRYVDDTESPNYGKLRTLSHYRQQLDVFMGDCKKGIYLEGLEYRAEALSKALIKHLACKTPGVAVAAPLKDAHMRAMWGLLAGASLNTFAGSGDHPLVERNELRSSVTPVFGIFVEAPLSRRRQQFSLNMELVYDNRKLTNSSPDRIDVNFQYLSLQTLFRYTYPVGELRPYVNGGVGIMAKLGKGKDEYRHEEFRQTLEALGGGRGLTLPLIAGAGLRYKQLNGEIRAVLPHILDDYLMMNVKSTTLQLIVRYALFK